ncbi:MAG: pyridoxamine 5'-phosphate oxidase [Acidimicrobiales bacterium]
MDIADLDDDPLRQLALWIEATRAAGEELPEAMCLATASADGDPSARMVLMRGLDHGLLFFTDYGSDKSRDLATNPRAAAVLHLPRPVRRQVRVRGPVSRVTPEESDRYWLSRPASSRRSATVSRQSSVIESRAVLESAVVALGDSDPARPDRWGGYRLTPVDVEFWQEGRARLHDRIRFVRDGDGWRAERLSP